MKKFRARLLDPIDIASLVYFRMAFGLLLSLYLFYMLGSGLIGPLFVGPLFHFTYLGFSWVKPWPGGLMQVHFLVTALAALAIALGLFYRLALAVFLCGWVYIFLLEKAYYLNHFYLVALFAFLLWFVPAHRAYALDAKRRPALRSSMAPAYALWILRLQMGIVYFYAGLSKLHPDWLHGEPMRGLVRRHLEGPLFGIISLDAMAYALSYGGLLFDLLVAPALLWSRTRHAAVLAALGFHLTNSFLFTIDFFPVLALAATLLFYPPDWPRRVFSALRPQSQGRLRDPRDGRDSRDSRGGDCPWGVAAVLVAYFAVQLLLPMRSLLYPGDHAWTEEGHRFSWHLMQRTKNGRAEFFVRDPGPGTTWRISPENYLNARQVREVAVQPDMMVQFAHFLEEQFRARGYPDVEVRVFARVSLNNRSPQLLADPKHDLTREVVSLRHQAWIQPLGPRSRRDGVAGADKSTNTE
ncbi:MAG: HTTM domain-containing protein [Candidatus Hydrogenedentes bacterium]|nr:HTTM domain-containing protein [Candidatus Hydrogenedentota bacterium]